MQNVVGYLIAETSKFFPEKWDIWMVNVSPNTVYINQP